MVEKVKIKPAKKGIKVKHPFHPRDIDEKGEEILNCPWVARRVKDGDIVIVTAKPKKKKGHQEKNKIDETENSSQADDS